MSLNFEDRIRLNKNRLLNYDDTYFDLYQKDSSMAWPGDFVGRYSLALSSLYEGLDDLEEKKEVLAALKDVIKNRVGKVNEHRFFGDLYNKELINEQQLSGNSWYIRSLVNYYRITNDEEILGDIKDIIENFLLKIAPHYLSYPVHESREDGQVSGHLEKKSVNGFLLSSDIGCAFILLDGYVDAYSVTKDERLKVAIESIIEVFKGIDYLKLNCQTHATLTCARAILRFYELTKNTKYLNMVISIFEDYQNHGMTIEYENINWFNRTDSWTEPCCVVDSFILARELYLITHEEKYLKLFGRITTNGIRIAQRNNGGAGCSTILWDKNSVLKNAIYEAWFCCSMRLGEGMKYLSTSRLIEEEPNKYLMLYPTSINKDGIKVVADYYYSNTLKITSSKDTTLSVYVPEGLKIKKVNSDYKRSSNLLTFTLTKNETIIVEYELTVLNENNAYFFGDMLLTRKDKHIEKVFEIDNSEYSYVLSNAELTKEETENIEQYL